MALCDKSYPKKLALIFLDELEKEFVGSCTSTEVEAATVPFAFQSFGAMRAARAAPHAH